MLIVAPSVGAIVIECPSCGNYEVAGGTWGTLAVLDTLVQTALKAGFELRTQRLFERRKGELFIRLLPDGKPLAELIRREDGARLCFIPELTINATGRYASESFPQRPDIVIEISNGEESRLLIFDPKYKLDSELSADSDSVGRPKKEDIDKMHAYRDAIRDRSKKRVVALASILYPGPTQIFGKGIAALRALPGEGEKLRANVSQIFSTALTAP